MMTREEHLEWAKKRALEYLENGDYPNAINSMMSDLGKHEELRGHSGILLGTMLRMGGFLKTERGVREWITGFR